MKLVHELAAQAQRVDLVVVLALGEREQLRLQLPQPLRVGGHVEATELHPPSDRLAAVGFIVTSYELFSRGVGLAGAHARFEVGANASGNLHFLFRPPAWFPFLHQITQALDPLLGSALGSPQVDEMHATLSVDADNSVDREVPAAC